VQLSLWGKMYGSTKQSPTIPAKVVIENCCWCLDWIVLCGFMPLWICTLWKFSMPFLVEPVFLAKSMWLLRNGSHHIVEGTTVIILGMGENQVDQIVQVHQLFMENLPHYHVCDKFDCLYLMNAGTGFSSMHLTMHSASAVGVFLHHLWFVIEGLTVWISLMQWSVASNVHGFKSLHWAHLSVYSVTGIAPLLQIFVVN
jgi:hypothetical protein